MPVEIREIVVKAYVDDTDDSASQKISEEKLEEMKNEIIEECMSMMMAELKRLNDR